jgi:branched-chain amino acid transport system permease protein
VDGLVMVMLGGIQTLTGPLWGAALFTWLQDAARARRRLLARRDRVVILALVLVLPKRLGSLLQAKK